MNRWCDCEEEARSGNIEGIEFEVCFSCENFSWEPTETKNFFAATINLRIVHRDPLGAEDTRAKFVAWLDHLLASFSHPFVTFDRSCLEAEALIKPLEDVCHETINLRMRKLELIQLDEAEESGWPGIDLSELQSLSDEELAKKVVIYLWRCMLDGYFDTQLESLIDHIEGHKCQFVSNPASQANPGYSVNVFCDRREFTWTLNEEWLEGTAGAEEIETFVIQRKNSIHESAENVHRLVRKQISDLSDEDLPNKYQRMYEAYLLETLTAAEGYELTKIMLKRFEKLEDAIRDLVFLVPLYKTSMSKVLNAYGISGGLNIEGLNIAELKMNLDDSLASYKASIELLVSASKIARTAKRYKSTVASAKKKVAKQVTYVRAAIEREIDSQSMPNNPGQMDIEHYDPDSD